MKLPFVWHAVHVTVVCAPVSGKGAVVERRTGPVGGAVADGTIQREIRGFVVRGGGAVIKSNVAGIAIGCRPDKHIVDVTGGARDCSMRTG